MHNRQLQVFLCYAREDKPTVHELYSRLVAESWVDPWLDEAKLLPGQDWDMEIEKAVETADVVVVCLSKNSIGKEGYVQRELRFVLDIAKEKPEDTIFIIPLRLDKYQVPRRLQALQYVDYFPTNVREVAYGRLLESLKLRAKKFNIIIETAKPNKEKQYDTKGKLNAGKPNNKVPSSETKNGYIANPEVELEQNINEQQREIKTKIKSYPRLGLTHKQILILSAVFIALIFFTLRAYSIFDQPPTQNTETPSILETESLPINGTEISPIDHANLLYIPGGAFTMGSDSATDELPVTLVDVDAFWIDATEVTNDMYEKCVQAGKCGLPSDTSYYNDPSYSRHPVAFVTWLDAKNYCEYAGRRLPAESEWEKAARSTDQRVYPWGNNAPTINLLNYDKNAGGTIMVGVHPNGNSPYLVMDMAGNVWEWVSSLYKNYPYRSWDGREDPNSTGFRVARGGSWIDKAEFVRTTVRFQFSPSTSLDYLGFRCAQSE